MIKYVYLLIVGIALYYGWRRWIARPRDGSGADPTGASPDAERKYLTSEELPALLRRVSDDISSFLDDASHPSECVENPAFRQAMEALARPETPLETVLQYVTGGSWPLSCAAAASLQHRADAREACERLLPELRILSPWPVYFILDCLNGLKDRLPAGAPVAVVNEWWVENPAMQRFFRDHFDKREEFGDPAVFGESASSLTAEQYKFSLDFLNSLRCPFAGRLAEELERIRRTTVDRAFLTTFGRLWQAADEPSLPVEADGWSEGLDAAALTVQRTPPRSLAVSGEQHVGKTSILRLLAHRLEAGGWQIFEAGAADLMAGQQWFGQLEERIKRAIEEVSAEKKLIWYVPDLLQLTASGTHQGQSASIFEQMLPAIASGKLILWTETTPAILSRLLQSFPVLRNLLEVLRVEPMTKDAATDLAKAAAERMAAGAGVTVEQNAIATAIETAPHYIANGNLPGAALTLLKLTVARAAKRESKEVTQQDVLETLSQLTGLPLSILDIDERLAVEEAREFFRKRVIGQDEAIDAIVDRIVMLKAGLNDPGKPIGVFLFAGPTGTGKTELAKTAAEYLFGSPDRLIRLDMSEFQSQEAMAKIIGDGNPADSGSLIARVRKQPFSLVLLDEFEKSHPRIWDLFLQVFDDGRLSDASGQTANFRHCIVVMTSNLGATDHQSAGFGFAPPSDSFGSEQVMRAISQTYRPEFQNRIDRIIVFRPLDRDLMRSILHKELDDLHQRRGLKDRQWAIEWEPSAIEFLLEKGFSADMGARPLKRAVDRYVLSPLAATIVEKRFPDGEQFVFMRSNGNAIQAEFVDPDADDTGASTLDAAIAGAQSGAEHAPPLAQIILSPAGSDREIAAIAMRLQEYAAAIDGPGISGEKDRLATRMSEPGFWETQDRRDVLSRYALIDRVRAALETAQAMQRRIAGTRNRKNERPRELIARLALQAHLVGEGIADIEGNAPVDVALCIVPAFEGANENSVRSREWKREMVAMYRGWCERRHMQVQALPGAGDTILIVSGFGAWRTLSREEGLHVFENDEETGRIAARVQVAEPSANDLPPAQHLRAIERHLEQKLPSNRIIRRYRREPSPMVRDMEAGWRTGRLEAVLRGDFDLVGQTIGDSE